MSKTKEDNIIRDEQMTDGSSSLSSTKITIPKETTKETLVKSIMQATPSKTASISKIPSEAEDYDRHYVLKLVSIGPYHYNNAKLKFLQSLKPFFTNKILLENEETLKALYDKLGEAKMIQELRGFYEENSTDHLSDLEFTKMMLLDGCFIMCFVSNINSSKASTDFMGLKVNQIPIVLMDLLLLENQIPYKVLVEVMNLVGNGESLAVDLDFTMKNLANLLQGSRRQWWLFKQLKEPNKKEENLKKDHLLQIFHYGMYLNSSSPSSPDHYTFRNISELLDVGIKFRPSKTCSIADVRFVRGWFSSSYLELPLIIMDDFGLTNMLNLSAYEMCHVNDIRGNIVTPYLCFLDSLIDHPEDVKVLREAKVIRSFLSDAEVAHQFNKVTANINFGLNRSAYQDVMSAIQQHCDTKPNRWHAQLKNMYFKSPWSFLALGGAMIGLLFSAVQTYYTIWSLPGECDDLCMSLKMNHHL